VNAGRIRALREAKGWSQRELARRAKVRQPSLSAIETGQAKRIDVAMLERIANALGADLVDLVTSSVKQRTAARGRR
jgi:transcriptional regulator with XRE-family HTH domain